LLPVAIVSIIAALFSYGAGYLLHLDMYPDGLMKLFVYMSIYLGWSFIFKPEAYTYFLTIIPAKFRFWERNRKKVKND